MNSFVTISFIAVWIVAAFYVITYYAVIVRIKSAHVELWKNLGSPDAFSRNNWQTSKTVWQFIEGKQGAIPNDPFLQFCIRVLNKGEMLRFIGLGYFILFVLYHIIKNNV